MNLNILVEEFNAALERRIPWPAEYFGIAQDITNPEGSRDTVFPACLDATGEYIDLRPSDVRGNYSFILKADPVEILESGRNSYRYIKTPASFVVWLNVADVETTAEEAQAQVLSAINRGLHLKSGSFTALKVYTKGASVFKGYSLKETDSQYLMHPYAGFRIEGFFQHKEDCK